MTEGGDGQRTKSEDSPGAKLTIEQVTMIKEKLKERWTANRIIDTFNLPVSYAAISAINHGVSWFDPNETYPLCKKNGCERWSDEEAMKIKYEWAEGANIADLATKYKVDVDRIGELVNGKSYIHLPIIERKVNYKRINHKARKFTEEQVLRWRSLVYQEGKSIQGLWLEEQVNCCYAAFYNMIKGITYKNYGGLPN